MHLPHEAAQLLPKRGERIFDVRALRTEVLALHDAVQLQFPQLRRQHPFADARQRLAQLRVTPRPREQFPQAEDLSLACDDREQALHFTFHSFELHAQNRHSKVPYCRNYIRVHVEAI